MSKWEIVRLGDVLKYEQPAKYIVESTDYDYRYETPVLTAGQSFVLGYTNEVNNIFTDLPVVIFDDFTTAIKYVDFPFKVKSSAMKILKATEKGNIKYLFYYMSTLKIDTQLHKRYWISKYTKLQIPLPSMEVQRQIADVLDRASALIEKRKAQIDKLDLLVKSQFIEIFGDPVTNPKGWRKTNLVEVASKIGSGATPKGGKGSYKKSGVSLIRSMNVYNGKFEYRQLAFIDDIQAEQLKNVAVEENDILLNITGASVGRCCLTPNDVLPARVNQHVSIIRPNKILNPIYLCYLMISQSYQKKLHILGNTGGATREAITKKQIENLDIPIPTLELQAQFADFAQQVETQKSLLQQSLAKLKLNYKSLTQKCFNGEVFNG